MHAWGMCVGYVHGLHRGGGVHGERGACVVKGSVCMEEECNYWNAFLLMNSHILRIKYVEISQILHIYFDSDLFNDLKQHTKD